MKRSVLALLLLPAAAFPLLTGCAERTVYVHEPPPPPAPPTEAVIATPGPGYVWVPGYWGWNGASWVWVGGRWAVPPRPAAVWVAPHWGYHGGVRIWVGGRWR